MGDALPAMKRWPTIVYIDGFNLFFALREHGWKAFYWYGIRKLAKSLCRTDQDLRGVKYFTSRINKPKSKAIRQSAFIDANVAFGGCSFFYGRFMPESVTCPNCKRPVWAPHEKKTDINIAVEFFTDAMAGEIQTAVLVTNDTDQVPVIERVQTLTGCRVIVAEPPGRHSDELRSVATGYIHITWAMMRDSLLPASFHDSDGVQHHCPAEWAVPLPPRPKRR